MYGSFLRESAYYTCGYIGTWCLGGEYIEIENEAAAILAKVLEL